MISNFKNNVGSNSRVEIAIAFLMPIVESRDFQRIVTYEELMDRFGLDLREMQSLMRRARYRLAKDKGFTFEIVKDANGYKLAPVESILGMCESGRRSIVRRSRRLQTLANCGFNQETTDDQKKRLISFQCQAGAMALAARDSTRKKIESKIANGNMPVFKIEMMK